MHCGAVVYSAKNVGVLQSQNFIIIRSHCLLAELPFQLLDFIIFKTQFCRALAERSCFYTHSRYGAISGKEFSLLHNVIHCKIAVEIFSHSLYRLFLRCVLAIFHCLYRVIATQSKLCIFINNALYFRRGAVNI